MNYIKTITQKGQLLIPKEIREYLGIELNDQVQIVIENGQVILKKPTKDLKEFAGIIRVDHRNLTEDDNEMFEVDNDFFAMSKPSANINSESEVNNFDQSNIYIDDYINTDEVSSETKTITNLNTEKISKEEAV
ncbi:MAG: AbrB/MazE/SpoVT family DNA-binding domain-containing protein, partial [Romboutsia sp.]|nr:AbrB/MazE/SpoVT family DNA-binding domain-containing protein [Romboutsia sp.]